MALARVYHMEALAAYSPEAKRQTYGLAIVDSVLNSSHVAGGLGGTWSEFDPSGIHRTWTDVRGALALPLGEHLSLGGTVRWLHVNQDRGVGPFRASYASDGDNGALFNAVTLDAGATVSLLDGLRIAVVGHNLTNPGTALAPITGAAAMPAAREELLLLDSAFRETMRRQLATKRVQRELARIAAQLLGVRDQRELADALWELVWAGLITNDSLAPLRVRLGTGRTRHSRPVSARRGRPVLPSRTGPPTVGGRWSLLPEPSTDETRRSHALAETLLDRYGVLTRGAVQAESVVGGFAAVYRVLKAFEDAGRCRRGYFVEGLGAAQFALPGAVDRLRTRAPSDPHADGPSAIVLAATDPANPYGAALSWPRSAGREVGDREGHRPGRKAGALVVLVVAGLLDRSAVRSDDEDAVVEAAVALFARPSRGSRRTKRARWIPSFTDAA